MLRSTSSGANESSSLQKTPDRARPVGPWLTILRPEPASAGADDHVTKDSFDAGNPALLGVDNLTRR